MRLLAAVRPLFPFALIIMMSSCSDELDRNLYVPADGYTCTVRISLPHEAKVGEWVLLRASRRSGPWRQIKRSELTDEPKAFAKRPPDFEDDVQANLHWSTDPPNVAQFNVPTVGDIESKPLERKVRFNQPGVFKIWAVTASPTTATSNVETISIIQTE